MDDLSHLTAKELKDKLFQLIQKRGSNLNRTQLLRLLNILVHDFGLSPSDPIATDADRDDRAREILTIDGVELQHPRIITAWSKDASILPRVNYADIFTYFILRPSSDINTATLPSYKSLEAYRLVDGDIGNIQVWIHASSGWCVVKGDVCASLTNKKLHQPWAVVHKDGTVRGGQCNCVAGLGETCSHVGAILFYLEKATRVGVNRDLMPTEQPCAWTEPTFHAETIPALTRSFIVSTRVKYDQSNRPNIVRDAAKCKQVREKLDRIARRSRLAGMFSVFNDVLLPPATSPDPVHMPIAEFETTSTTPWLPTIKELVRSHLASDIPVASICDVLFQSIKGSVDEELSIKIEECTRDQSSSSVWKECRLGRITASIAHPVYTYYNQRNSRIPTDRAPPTYAIGLVLNPKNISGLPGPDWGIGQEATARNAFLDSKIASHPGMRIEGRGLLIPPGKGHIGASIDGLVFCDCGVCPPMKILEVKCPEGIKNEDPNVPTIAKRLPYLIVSGSSISVNTKSRYYCQVQMQLGCWKLQSAYLFIWTTKGHLLFNIEFDSVYWAQLLERMEHFYSDFIVPNLLSSIQGV